MSKVKTTVLSVNNAVKGLGHIIKEKNFQVHLLATVAVSVAALCLGVTQTELLVVVLVVNNVLSAESFNTAIEEVTDLQRDKQGLSYEDVGKAKDIAAGAVLVNALMAVAIAVIILSNYV